MSNFIVTFLICKFLVLPVLKTSSTNIAANNEAHLQFANNRFTSQNNSVYNTLTDVNTFGPNYKTYYRSSSELSSKNMSEQDINHRIKKGNKSCFSYDSLANKSATEVSYHIQPAFPHENNQFSEYSSSVDIETLYNNCPQVRENLLQLLALINYTDSLEEPRSLSNEYNSHAQVPFFAQSRNEASTGSNFKNQQYFMQKTSQGRNSSHLLNQNQGVTRKNQLLESSRKEGLSEIAFNKDHRISSGSSQHKQKNKSMNAQNELPNPPIRDHSHYFKAIANDSAVKKSISKNKKLTSLEIKSLTIDQLLSNDLYNNIRLIEHNIDNEYKTVSKNIEFFKVFSMNFSGILNHQSKFELINKLINPNLLLVKYLIEKKESIVFEIIEKKLISPILFIDICAGIHNSVFYRYDQKYPFELIDHFRKTFINEKNHLISLICSKYPLFFEHSLSAVDYFGRFFEEEFFEEEFILENSRIKTRGFIFEIIGLFSIYPDAVPEFIQFSIIKLFRHFYEAENAPKRVHFRALLRLIEYRNFNPYLLMGKSYEKMTKYLRNWRNDIIKAIDHPTLAYGP